MVTLSITNSVSVDNKVSWVLALVVLCELLDGLKNRVPHVVLNNLLAFLLDQEVAVVLRHFSVERSREANNGLGPCMADINTNKHRALLLECFWKLQMVEIASDFTVHLPQNVGRL